MVVSIVIMNFPDLANAMRFDLRCSRISLLTFNRMSWGENQKVEMNFVQRVWERETEQIEKEKWKNNSKKNFMLQRSENEIRNHHFDDFWCVKW